MRAMLTAVIATAGAVYLAVGLVAAGRPGAEADPDRILDIARNLCARQEFAIRPGEPTVVRGPAYPVALALPCWLADVDPARVAPVVTAASHVLLLLLLAAHPLAGGGARRAVAIAAVGFDPLLLNYAGRGYLEATLVLAVALVVAAVDRVARRPDARGALLLGLAWGGSLLVKPILLTLPLVLVPVLLVAASRRAAAVAAGATLLGIVVIAPWVVRNHAVTGRVVPVATAAWSIALKGDVYSRLLFRRDGAVALEHAAADELDAIDRRHGIAGRPLHEREPFYRSELLDRVRRHPGDLVRKLVLQAGQFWVLGGDVHKTLLFALLQLPVLMLAAAALAHGVPGGARALLGTGVVVGYCWAVHAASLAMARYSAPVRPWLVLLAAGFVAERALAARRRPRCEVASRPAVVGLGASGVARSGHAG